MDNCAYSLYEEEEYYPNEDNTEDLLQFLPQGQVLDELVNLFGLFSDCTRLRILSALSITYMTVSEISDLLKLNQSTVSHQLRTLKDLNAVQCKRLGKTAVYSLKNKVFNDILLNAVIYLGY